MKKMVIEIIDKVKCRLLDKAKVDNDYFLCFANVEDANDLYFRKYDKKTEELLKLTEEECELALRLFRQRNAI